MLSGITVFQAYRQQPDIFLPILILEACQYLENTEECVTRRSLNAVFTNEWFDSLLLSTKSSRSDEGLQSYTLGVPCGRPFEFIRKQCWRHKQAPNVVAVEDHRNSHIRQRSHLKDREAYEEQQRKGIFNTENLAKNAGATPAGLLIAKSKQKTESTQKLERYSRLPRRRLFQLK